ncbi:hypothetical protein SAMN04487902_101249 [Prevotella sp. ne3005]|uniref:phage baseplate assembly protein V n=1 Tax=Prevotella sp. ne3005 TaxID=1761887 RepID=UPI0008CD9386|nr:phage baseplate assembly protein V [Prevotella sp. ne3005]SEM51405.1 hypothetical protein SAMN04487902_101249 [Prevotella sp. ne3005]
MATYKLTVGDIKDIELSKDTAKVTINSIVYSVIMESLTYTKKIFAPNEIHTVLSIVKKTDTIADPPKLSELQSVFSKKLVTLYDDTVKVAENFFVYKMKPSRSKDGQQSSVLKVELFIYSLDKLLTIDKYCNAFTGKKLGGEIFTDEIKKFKIGSTALEGAVNLQILNYVSEVEKDDKDNKKTVEVRQPYLVQYNESFYDFMARSAIRCGEMLYFEGGKLHLGMPVVLKVTDDQATKADSVDLEDCMERAVPLSDRHYNYMDRSKDNDNRYTNSTFSLIGRFVSTEDPVITGKKEDGKVTEVTTNNCECGKTTITVEKVYFTDKSTSPANKLKGELSSVTTTYKVEDSSGNALLMETEKVEYIYELDKGKNDYKKEDGKYVYTTKKTITEPTTGSNDETSLGNYNLPMSNDAVFEELKKDGYTSLVDEWFDYRTFLFNDLFLNLLDSTTLYDAIADLASGLLWGLGEADMAQRKKNNKNNDVNLTLTSTKNPDQTDDSTFNLFSTLKANMKPSTFDVNKEGSVVSLLVADFYSKMRMAATTVSQVRVRLNYGSSNPGLCLGDVIKVDDDYYVVVQVELDGKDHVVEAIPPFYKKVENNKLSAAIPCPPLMPEIPDVRTSDAQVAFVENNLDPNKLGRVRVRFPWQLKDGDCSPWIRMATPFATNGGGVTFKPEKGDEVLLNFEDGNIERPYIVGSLQSKYVTDNWGALADRVVQSKNGHAITFTDKDDGLAFLTGMAPQVNPLVTFIKSFLPASDQLITFQNMVDLTGGIKISDRYGLYSINMSSDGRQVNINSPLGDVKLNAFTGITISAPNGNIDIKGKNVTIAASNKLTLESGSAVSDRYINKDAFTSKDGFLTSLVGIGTDMLDRTLGKLIDLSFFRTIFEVFTRPVDGTLKIRSNTYLLLEAGKGSAQVPHADFNRPKWEGVQGNDYVAQAPLLGKLTNTIDALTSDTTTVCQKMKTAFNKSKTKKSDYEKTDVSGFKCYDSLTKMKVNDIVQKVYAKRTDKNFSIYTVIEEKDFDFDNTEGFKLKIGDKKFEKPNQKENEEKKAYGLRIKEAYEAYKRDKADDNKIIRPRRAVVLEKARILGFQLKVLFDTVAAWKNFKFNAAHQGDLYYSSDSIIKKVQDLNIFDNFVSKVDGGTVEFDKDVFKDFDKDLIKIHREIVYELITEVKTKDGYKDMFSVDSKATKPDFGDDAKWKEYADYIGDPTSVASYDVGAKTYFKNYFKTNFLNDWIDAVGNPLSNQWKWKAPEKGRILISDTPGRTIHFDAEQLVTDHNFGEVTNSHPIELRRIVNAVK